MLQGNPFAESKNSYEKISPTAWGVAYHRSQSDIKYAQEIFDELDAVVKPTDPLEIEYLKRSKESKIAPQFEARYKLIDRLIAENKTNQILEIASGLAPRGLEMTEKDPSLRYVEVDLPVMTRYKREILQALFEKGKAKPQPNLYIEDGDALDYNSLLAAVRYFKNEPITIVNEGLLRYMNFDQKAIVAKNIHALLEKFGGTWITSDITLIRLLKRDEERKANVKMVQALSGMNVEDNAFESEQAAVKFFEDAGFSVERHSFLEIIENLVSPAKINLSPEETRKLLEHPVVFMMRVKG